nr:hypothetical protein [Thalassionema frauenfeldii]
MTNHYKEKLMYRSKLFKILITCLVYAFGAFLNSMYMEVMYEPLSKTDTFITKRQFVDSLKMVQFFINVVKQYTTIVTALAAEDFTKISPKFLLDPILVF